MTKKKQANLITETKNLYCGGSSLEELTEQYERFVSLLPLGTENIFSCFDKEPDEWDGSDKVVLTVSWARPATEQDIRKQKAEEEGRRQAKLRHYEALKKELGL